MSDMRKLQIQGHEIVALPFNEEKTGTPTIFVHGLTASIHFWGASNPPVIQERTRWYSLSLPGHYPAKFPGDFRTEDLTAEMMASVLGAAIRELVGDRPANLVGHSLGGFSALDIAAHMPELVHSIICISGLAHCQCIGSIGKLQGLARGGAFARLLFRMNLRLPSLSPSIFRTALGQYAADQEALYAWPGLQEGLDSSYPDAKQLDGRAMFQYFNRLPDIDITDLLGQITAPTLVLGGEADPIVSPAQFHLIAEKVPNSELVLWEGCGHLPQGERSAEYQEAIAGWIGNHT